MLKKLKILSAMLLLFIAVCSSECSAFPADADWVPILVNGVPKQDPINDANTYKNLVSDPGNSTTYFFNDGDYMYFRLRLDGSPQGTGGQGELKPNGWGVAFDTNADTSDYEWLIMIDGISNPEAIGFWENVVKESLGDPSDKPEVLHVSTGLPGNLRIVQADTFLNGDADYFLDFRFSYTDFKSITGLDESSAIRIFEGSSSSGNVLQESGADFASEYSDFFNYYGITPQTAAIRFVSDISGNGDVAQAEPGDTLYIRIDDPDVNLATDTIEVISASVSAPTGETETVTLTETGADTGVFTALLPTEEGAVAGPDNDGKLVVKDTDTILASYVDPAGADGVPVTVTDTLAIITAPPGYSGSIASTASILPGDTVTITVSDPDLNTDPAIIESVVINAVNQNTGEAESVTCFETAVDSGVFTGTFNTTLGAAADTDNNGTMNVVSGNIIVSTYNEAADMNGNPAVLTANTDVTGGVTGILTASPSVSPGEPVVITLNDADLNTNPSSIQTINITSTNISTGETETVTLTESSSNSASFTVSFPTAYNTAAGTNNDGIYWVLNGQTITFTYNDALNSEGGTQSVSDTTSIIDDSNSVTIISPIGNYTYDTHDVTGTTDPYSSVIFTHPLTGAVLSVSADSNGNFIFSSIEFPQGITTYSVSSTDSSGNPAADIATVNIDSSNFITVTSPVTGSVINVLLADISGLTDPDSTVTMVEPGTGNTLTTKADFEGKYSFPDVGLNTGINNLALESTDPVGNIAVTTHVIKTDLSIVLNITSIADGTTYNFSQHEIAGTTDPIAGLDSVHPSTGTPIATTAAESGQYSFGSFSFPDGPNTVSVSATDEAGNFATATVSFFVDTVNTNNITTSGLFTVTGIDLSGTTDPGSTVVFVSPLNGETLTAVADSGGNYTIHDIPLKDGDFTLSTTSTDPYGNIAAAVTTVTIDSSVSITITSPANNSVVDTIPIDIDGTTDPLSTVTSIDPVTSAPLSVVSDASGLFTFSGVNLNPGNNPMLFTATDPAGNTATTTHSIFYDPDITLSITSIVDGSIVNSNVQAVSGLTSPFTVVSMNDPVTGNPLTTTADASGQYTFGSFTFNDSVNTVTVSAQDPFGDDVQASVTFTVVSSGVDAVLNASSRTVFGYPIYIVLEDKETYWNPSARDTVTVSVHNPSTGDTETLVLIESTPDSRTFTGLLNTSERAVSDGDDSGTISVLYGDIITTSYVDAITAGNLLNVTITDQTLITNDEIRINVNILSTTGESRTMPLSGQDISIIEFDTGGNPTGRIQNCVTTADGNIPTEFIGRMYDGMSYRILLKKSFNSYPYSQSDEFGISQLQSITPDSRGVKTLVIVLDPAGYVYDAISGERIDGADVTFYHEDGYRVSGPFSFYTNAPSELQTNPQFSGASGIAGGFEFIGNSSGSDITAGNYYITVTFENSSSLENLYLPVEKSSGTWSGIRQPYRGQIFPVDQDNQPTGMRIPLTPIDLSVPINIVKNSDKEYASVGDIITFTLTVMNLSTSATDPNHPVLVADTLPQGLSYIDNSAFDSEGRPVTAYRNGNSVKFEIGRLLPVGDIDGNDRAVIYYRAAVNTASIPGTYITNSALAEINTVVLSNTSSVTIRITEDPLLDMATLIGKVFGDINGNGIQDPGEKGIPDAGILLDNGTYATTDKNGKYSVPGIPVESEVSRYRAVKIDMNTLPCGSIATTRDTLFVELTPGGLSKANFGIITGDGGENNCKSGPLSLFVIDGATGEIKSGAGEQLRPNLESLSEGGLAYGRNAFFYKGNVLKKFELTTSFDSQKRNSFTLGPDMDNDLYYPTYGDDGRVRFLAGSQGRFYLNASSASGNLLYGNYSVEFANTGLAGIRRTLHGVKFEFNRKWDIEGSPRNDSLIVFTSEKKQMQARAEFRSNGDTIYYLPHNDVVSGSEKITVEIRNSFMPENVSESLTLINGTDYDIDCITGRIRLYRPVAMYADSSSLSTEYAVHSGDPVWLVAEYSYYTPGNMAGVTGARVLHKIDKNVSVGTSFLREDNDGGTHELRAVDFHLGDSGKEIFGLELGRSTESNFARYASLDGGRSFTELGNLHDSAGSGFKGHLDLDLNQKLKWHYQYSDIDPEFEGGSYSERGIRRSGAGLLFDDGDLVMKAEYTRAHSFENSDETALLNSGGGSYRALRLSIGKEYKNSNLQAEYAHKHNVTEAPAYNIEKGTDDSLIVRYIKYINQRMSAGLGQQVSFSSERYHRSMLGIKYQMRKDISFSVEAVNSSYGRGGKLGFEKELKRGRKLYINSSSDWSRTYGEKMNIINAGASAPLSGSSDGFFEYGAVSRDDETTISRTLGINHRYDAGGELGISMSAERSEERSSLNGRYFTNTAGISAGLNLPGDSKISTGAEYRRNNGSIEKEHFAFNFQIDDIYLDDAELFSEYLYSASTDLGLDTTESKYTKGLLGLALRPDHNDKVNFFVKLARIRELRTSAVNSGVLPDEVSNVLSFEGLFDATDSLQINEKIASKTTLSRLSGTSGKVHTTLWITGMKYRISEKWDTKIEFRTRHQPSQLNYSNGISAETGYYITKHVRLGAGYNFSSYSDNEFVSNSYSYRGAIFRIQGAF
ncbi:MAG TPA: hypothetical protein PLN69_05795 [bacterium]|nr:hypothetical protein [bacterium]